VLLPTPGQIQVCVVAAVHEHSTGFDLVDKPYTLCDIARPNARSECKLTVVNPFECLFIAFDWLDAGDWSEEFLAHDAHGMIDVRQQGRCNITVPSRWIVLVQ
jgi:hypothetical protein